MKIPLAMAAAFLLAAPSEPTPGYNTRISTAAAPERFQGDNATIVLFLSDVRDFCDEAPPGYQTIACVRIADDGTPVMALPNPCLFPDYPYAHIACHELGHVNLWPAEHPE